MERFMYESCVQTAHDDCPGKWLRIHGCTCPCHEPAESFQYDTVEEFVRAFKRCA